MGYFSQQIYNDPMSMYVDPKLDILANSLGAVQKRHDENYANMSALDLMANNTQVADGDKDIKDAALGRLKQQRDAIAASGQYAYATPQIGMAVRDWSGDQNLNMAKENMIAIKEAEKQRQAMLAAGHSVLDFNDPTGWKTIGADGKARRYVAQNEKELDYDSRAQEVSKILASTRNLGLTPANIKDFLQSGSITGINDTQVKNNLENSIMRFMNSPEGDQMKRKLTKIKGMDPNAADDYISNYLFSVGKAQTFQKEDINYQVNTPAVQDRNREDQQAHDREMADLSFKRAMALQNAKAKADADEEARKVAKKEKEEGFPVSPLSVMTSAAGKTNADNSFGTNQSNVDAADVFFPGVDIKDPETGNSFKGLRVPMEIATMGNKYNPQTGTFTKDEVEIAKNYFLREDRLKKAKDELKKLDTGPTLPGRGQLAVPTGTVGGLGNQRIGGEEPQDIKNKRSDLNDEIQRLERGYSDRDIEMVKWRNKGKPEAQVTNAVNTFKEKFKHRGTTTEGGKDRTVAENYRTAFEGDGAKYYDAIGKKLSGTTVDASFSSREPTNTYRADGKLYGNFETKMKGSVLKEKLSSDELDWGKEHDLIGGAKGGKIEDDGYYTVNFVSHMPESPTIYENYNKKMGVTDAAKYHADYMAQDTKTVRNAADMNTKMQYLEANPSLSNDPEKPYFFRDKIKENLKTVLDNQEAQYIAEAKAKIKDPKAREARIGYIKQQAKEALGNMDYVDNFSNLPRQKQEAFISYLQENGI